VVVRLLLVVVTTVFPVSADEAVRAEAAVGALMWAAWTVEHSPGIQHQARAVTEIRDRAAALAASTAGGTDEAGRMLARYYDLMDEMAGDDQVLRKRIAAGRARLAARSGDDGLRQRCSSCEHEARFHQPDGCWYSVTNARPNTTVGCHCGMPRRALAGPEAPQHDDGSGRG